MAYPEVDITIRTVDFFDKGLKIYNDIQNGHHITPVIACLRSSNCFKLMIQQY